MKGWSQSLHLYVTKLGDLQYASKCLCKNAVSAVDRSHEHKSLLRGFPDAVDDRDTETVKSLLFRKRAC